MTQIDLGQKRMVMEEKEGDFVSPQNVKLEPSLDLYQSKLEGKYVDRAVGFQGKRVEAIAASQPSTDLVDELQKA